MVVAFYFRLHLAYFPRPVVAIFARPEHCCEEGVLSAVKKREFPRKHYFFDLCPDQASQVR